MMGIAWSIFLYNQFLAKCKYEYQIQKSKLFWWKTQSIISYRLKSMDDLRYSNPEIIDHFGSVDFDLFNIFVPILSRWSLQCTR